jgi:hypothetical protein
MRTLAHGGGRCSGRITAHRAVELCDRMLVPRGLPEAWYCKNMWLMLSTSDDEPEDRMCEVQVLEVRVRIPGVRSPC